MVRAWNPTRWVTRSAERIVFKVALRLTGWLRNHASWRWDLLMRIQGVGPSAVDKQYNNEGYGQSNVTKAMQNSNPELALEMAIQQPETPEMLRQNPEVSKIPAWASEVAPFLANQLSEHTRRAYETDLKQFFRFIEDKIDLTTLDNLAPQHVILFRKALEQGRITGKVMSPATVNRKLAVIKSFLNWLRAHQKVQQNAAQLVKGYPQSQESALKGLSDEEVCKILAIPNINSKSGALHHAVLTVLLYLGLRKGELIRLQMGDMDTERGVPVLRVRGKGHRVRILPLTERVRVVLNHYFWACKRDRMAKEEPMFIPTKNPRTGQVLKALNPNAITYMVVRYAKKAGILKTISPHSCRATCISNALDKRATHRSVQALAGWSTPLMIQRYDKRREDLKNSAAFEIDYGEVAEAN